ncbi:MAG: hypothetical protein M1816_000511 [Peltula sp. TS41687]|nr:MAG: hypothetical protein M1816_000511 [Peltula sp. TS41687]
MISLLVGTGLFLQAVLAVPTALSDCSRTSPQPCKCPAETTYHTCTSYVTVGANAFDVYNLTGDCKQQIHFSRTNLDGPPSLWCGFRYAKYVWDLSWIPQPVNKTHGPDNTVGSIRSTYINSDIGVYEWVEEPAVPVYFHHGPGAFAGEWITFKGEYVDEYETKISWNVYGCHSGGMHSEAISPAKTQPKTSRYVLSRIQSLLLKDGKIKGDNSDPYSVVGLPQKMALTSRLTGEVESLTARWQNQHVMADDKSSNARGSDQSASRYSPADSLDAKISKLARLLRGLLVVA